MVGLSPAWQGELALIVKGFGLDPAKQLVKRRGPPKAAFLEICGCQRWHACWKGLRGGRKITGYSSLRNGLFLPVGNGLVVTSLEHEELTAFVSLYQRGDGLGRIRWIGYVYQGRPDGQIHVRQIMVSGLEMPPFFACGDVQCDDRRRIGLVELPAMTTKVIGSGITHGQVHHLIPAPARKPNRPAQIARLFRSSAHHKKCLGWKPAWHQR